MIKHALIELQEEEMWRKFKHNEYQNKWRKEHKAQYKQTKRRYYRKNTHALPTARRRWTDKEDALVLGHHYEDSILAKELKRTVQAIHVRRWKLQTILNKTSEGCDE